MKSGAAMLYLSPLFRNFTSEAKRTLVAGRLFGILIFVAAGSSIVTAAVLLAMQVQ